MNTSTKLNKKRVKRNTVAKTTDPSVAFCESMERIFETYYKAMLKEKRRNGKMNKTK